MSPTRHRSLRVPAVALLVALGGCVTWGAGRPVAESDSLPRHARVILRDGTRHEVLQLLMTGDSLTGLDATRPTRHVAYPVAEVATVQPAEFSAGRTWAFVGATVAVLGGLVAALVAAIAHSGW